MVCKLGLSSIFPSIIFGLSSGILIFNLLYISNYKGSAITGVLVYSRRTSVLLFRFGLYEVAFGVVCY